MFAGNPVVCAVLIRSWRTGAPSSLSRARATATDPATQAAKPHRCANARPCPLFSILAFLAFWHFSTLEKKGKKGGRNSPKLGSMAERKFGLFARSRRVLATTGCYISPSPRLLRNAGTAVKGKTRNPRLVNRSTSTAKDRIDRIAKVGLNPCPTAAIISAARSLRTFTTVYNVAARLDPPETIYITHRSVDNSNWHPT
jgi:hypothetical protein